jgi:hypothetical protein
MRQSLTYGSVRGASRKARPYRDRGFLTWQVWWQKQRTAEYRTRNVELRSEDDDGVALDTLALGSCFHLGLLRFLVRYSAVRLS